MPVQGFSFKTIWRQGPTVTPQYSKFDTAGTIINMDMFTNFKNYYWTGCDATNPSYNSTGLPEYYVIEKSGTSDWSIYNYWKHASTIPRSDLTKYVQAIEPIIEFNLNLESQLISAKTVKGQLPAFNRFIFDPITSTYQLANTFAQLNASVDPTNNDAYLSGHLFARVADLAPGVQAAINTNPNILANNCFMHNNVNYIQGLFNGAYYPVDDAGFVHGYKVRNVAYAGTGDGELTISSIDSSSYPELITFTYNGTSFDVAGDITGVFYTSLFTDTPYIVNGCTIHIVAGNSIFSIGDKFTIEIASYVFYPRSLYVNISGVYRTLGSSSEIINEVQNIKVIPSNPVNQDGIWKVPPQIEWNVSNETRTQINEGDLYYHFTSIIGAQQNFTGSSTGSNNWRKLTSDVGRGGTIKQFDEDSALLISNIIQDGISTASLVDFARESYQSLSTSIAQFVLNTIPDLLVTGQFTPPTSGDLIDPIVVDAFKTYFRAQNSVVIVSPSVVDDTVSSPFYDSTSSLFNLVVTLPYLGLAQKVQPKKFLDLELNLPMLMHHDGHETGLIINSVDVAKKIVQKSYVRSPGQETPGIFSGFDYPVKPYAGQFWFKTSTGQLFVFNSTSDDGSRISGAKYGAYAYDRATNDIWQNNGVDNWFYLGNSTVDSALPWVEVKLDLITQNLELAIETDLYNQCPSLTPRLNDTALKADSHYNTLMASELEQFGVTYGSVDVYATTFDQNNAFTWNYSGVIAPGAHTGAHATWQDVYQDVYGTARPDLQPWILTDDTESAFIALMISLTLLPIGTTSFNSTTMWPLIGAYVKAHLLAGIPSRISVNLLTGTLLPPYTQGSAESLLFSQPSTLNDSFPFGTNGPIERFWRKTLNFLYSQQKTFFKIDPLTYVRETWGIKHQQIGEYTLASQLGRKEAPADFVLHGESLVEFAQPSWAIVSAVSNPSASHTYKFMCVSRVDGIFKLTIDNNSPTFLTLNASTVGASIINSLSYIDSYINVALNPTLRGFFYGDTYTITIDPTGTIVTTDSPQVYFRAEGFNQLFVQYGRIYGTDTIVSINTSLLKNWKTKLGYRFSGMVNTDNLIIASQDSAIPSSAYTVLLKENDFYNSSWINALRVQLVQVGNTVLSNGVNVPAIGPNGTPGEDWVFRVDNYNKNRTSLSWYNYDVTGEQQLFTALNGAHTLFHWTHYQKTTTIQSHNSPFLITGIQNFINFIFGYADKLAADGWRFDDPNSPRTDTVAGYPPGYQNLVERFIDLQFTGVSAGSSFGFNPFYNKVWYATPHGVVSGIFNVIGLENETVCSVLDQNNKQIANKDIRVFRQDDLTELIFDTPVYTIHLLTSEYEHVVLFENYSTKTMLLYDAFLGQRANRIFIEGQKQANFNGKIDFGGHFLLGNTMKNNIENSVSGILEMYDTTAVNADPKIIEKSRALLGYQKKSYFDARLSTDSTQFRFWQGLIANKGTNFSIGAFVNSASFQDAQLQEYWAYKVAQYGNSKLITKTEVIVQPEDCVGEYANYVFLEADDVTVASKDPSNQYDMVVYDYSGYSSNINTDILGMTPISIGDPLRWFSYSDINQLSYFEATQIARMFLPPTTSITIGDCFTITDSFGKPVRADCFEIVNSMSTSPSAQIFHESGDYINNSTPYQFTYPRFARINSSTIKILDLGGITTLPGSFIPGASYTITSVGTTDFTLIGAASNTIGEIFTATATGYIPVDATSMITGQVYKIKKVGTTDFTMLGLPGVIATQCMVGTMYTILSIGTTDFTLMGAASNTIGLSFTTTIHGHGTGVAATNEVGLIFTANGPGTGTGTVVWAGTGTAQTTVVTGTLEVVAYGPAAKQYSPNLLYNYKENTLVKNDIIWWDPARGIHHPQAAASIDFDNAVDPALYTNSICQYKNANTDKLKPWGSNQVGQIWWNTENLHWKLYSDDKDSPTLFNRLSSWGALSDMSAINVYEWVKSSTPPSNATLGSNIGEPAISNYVSRNRTWWQRPVAWRYSPNPELITRAFLAYQPSDLQIVTSPTITAGNFVVGRIYTIASIGTTNFTSIGATNNAIGLTFTASGIGSGTGTASISASSGLAVLKTGDFDNLGITRGTKISAARYTSTSKTENTMSTIFGLATVTSSAGTVVVGSTAGYADGPKFQTTNTSLNNLQVNVDSNILKFRTNYLGQYVMTTDVTNTYIILTHMLSSVSQQILLSDVPYVGNQITYNFDALGVTVNINMNVLHYYFIGPVQAGSLLNGVEYTIISQGTSTSTFTDFTLLGAANNFPGTTFTLTPVAAGSFVIATSYTILNMGSTDFVSIGAVSHTAGSFIYGNNYIITSLGSTDFTLIGASSNTIGTHFTAFGIGVGTGTAISDVFAATGQGSGTGTAFFPGSGTGTASSFSSRTLAVANSLISSSNEIWLRSSVDVLVPMIFNDGTTQTIFNAASTLSTLGWIAWNDPTINPNQGVIPPSNQYEPIAGSWVQVSSYLHDVSTDIVTRMSDPWTWFDGSDFTPYKSSWTQWAEIKPTIFEAQYMMKHTDTTSSFNALFTFPGFSLYDIQTRASVYVDERLMLPTQWSIVMSGTSPMIVINPTLIKQGDNMRVVIKAYSPTLAELSFDPTVNDTNPFLVKQYQKDYPYVIESLRDSNNNKTINNYYYWAKNKTTSGMPGKLSTTLVTNLLIAHDGIYAIPQHLKFTNQIDNRPNRYSTLSIKGLGNEVHGVNSFKLRLNKDPSLRDRDENITLKSVYTEWKLLRKGQIDLIPVELWNTLVDTLAGSTKLNQALPFDTFKLYDQQHNTKVSYGVDVGQVMTNTKFAIDTVKYTIRNTQVDKYINGTFVPDYITYAGFDIAQLDNYLSSTPNIRQFMSDLWRFAKTTQVNEIFFAVLEDMAANNLEIDMFFKTSFISLSNIKTPIISG